MDKLVISGRGAGIALSLAAATISLPGIVNAGPGCMNDQRMWRGGYPHSPVVPQAAYGLPGPSVYQAAPAPYAARMPVAYGRPMAVRQGGTVPAATPGRPESTMTAAAQSGEAAGETVTVRISGMRFEPASISVKPGTRVTWVQADGMPHIISGEASGLRSNTLYSGQQYSYIFQKPGSYDYVCDLHPAMKGSVVVEEAATGT